MSLPVSMQSNLLCCAFDGPTALPHSAKLSTPSPSLSEFTITDHAGGPEELELEQKASAVD